MKVIVNVKGGYGNQLFCYAFGYALSKELQAKLWLDTSLLDQRMLKNRQTEIFHLKITYDKLAAYPYNKKFLYKKLGINRIRKRNVIGWKTKIYKEKKKMEYDPDVFLINKDTYFDGFWQNPGYFDQYREELLELLQPKEEKTESVYKLSDQMKKETSVSVHIRRGDYIGLGWSLPMTYFETAMEEIEGLLGCMPCYYIFSDDMEFVKDYFKDSKRHIRYIDYKSDNYVRDDMYLMSQCRHNIIANSSYSWWGAYQNRHSDRIVICPVLGIWTEEFYPSGWKKIKL